MRRLIINADDFGLTSGVNRAILEAYSGGVVTSATLMANSAAFEEAVHLASLTDQLEVGCHVVLVDGSPLMGTVNVQTLIDKAHGAHFRDSAASLGLAAWAGRVDTKHIAAEATAQIGKLLSAGIKVTHLDTHKHVHMFPRVLDGVLLAAQACGVRAIRNPFETLRLSQFRASGKRWLQVKALRLLAGKFRQKVTRAGMITTDGSLGVVATGSLDHAAFRDLIENCPQGTWELICHPGYADRDLSSIKTRLRQSRALELEVLTSTAAHDLLQHEGIELISYRDLV